MLEIVFDRLVRLSPRELQVVRLSFAGMSPRTIARALGVSRWRARNCKQIALRKLMAPCPARTGVEA
jgi:DNA-binding CsgD family transcriptional regulator